MVLSLVCVPITHVGMGNHLDKRPAAFVAKQRRQIPAMGAFNSRNVDTYTDAAAKEDRMTGAGQQLRIHVLHVVVVVVILSSRIFASVSGPPKSAYHTVKTSQTRVGIPHSRPRLLKVSLSKPRTHGIHTFDVQLTGEPGCAVLTNLLHLVRLHHLQHGCTRGIHGNGNIVPELFDLANGEALD